MEYAICNYAICNYAVLQFAICSFAIYAIFINQVDKEVKFPLNMYDKNSYHFFEVKFPLFFGNIVQEYDIEKDTKKVKKLPRAGEKEKKFHKLLTIIQYITLIIIIPIMQFLHYAICNFFICNFCNLQFASFAI